MSIIRRAGADSLKLIQMAADPAAVAGQVQVYPKAVAGVAQLFARVGDGTVYQLTPPLAGIEIRFNGVIIGPGPWTILDFKLAGVQVNDLGAGLAEILIPGSAAYFPDQWFQPAVSRDLTNVAISTRLSNFGNFKAVRGGSITGLVTRFDTPVTAGSLTVEVTNNGALAGPSIVHTPGSNPEGGTDTEAPGVIPYAAGDLIGVRISTSADFEPDGGLELEANVSFFEGL